MAADRQGLNTPRGRPPALFPLFAGAGTLPGIGEKAETALAQIGITRPRDLILTLPSGGVARRQVCLLYTSDAADE